MRVIITAPSRLHFALIDLNGELGRVDGGIGVALKEPALCIEVSVVGNPVEDNPEEVVPVIERLSSIIKPAQRRNYRVKILKRLPSHVGMGSRTQLSLSVAKAISVLERRHDSAAELAKLVGRGGTSGIGTAAFEHGGFILDGGHRFQKTGDTNAIEPGAAKAGFMPSSASTVAPPPVLFQHPLPEDWFFVVAIPGVKRGAHGAEEIDIFKRYCPIERSEVEKICRIVLMRILPSVVENDITTFAESLTLLQEIGFKRIETELQDDIIKALFRFFDGHALGYGMSSFGPGTYAVVEGAKRAKALADSTSDFFRERDMQALVYYSNANSSGCGCEVMY